MGHKLLETVRPRHRRRLLRADATSEPPHGHSRHIRGQRRRPARALRSRRREARQDGRLDT